MQYAHLGGVPEAVAIVVPAVLLVVILRAGRKQAERDDAREAAERDEPPSGT